MAVLLVYISKFMTSTFCAAIHHHINLTPNGYIEPCCVWTKDDSDQEFKFTQLEEYKNSAQLKKFKQDLDSGIKLPQCRLCWRQEEIGQSSQRMMYNKWLTRDDSKLTSVEFKLGNLCDLKCVMCNGENSSQISTEYKLHRQKFEKFDQIIMKPGYSNIFIKSQNTSDFNWPESEEFKSFTDLIKDDLKEIILTGGEPTIIPYVTRLLANLPNPENVRLTMITNANSTNTRLIEILKNFKHVNVTVSLEGVEDHNDMVRFNSDWNCVVENIHRYKELPNVSIKINHVLQAFSVTTLIPLIQWTRAQGLELRFTPLFSPLHLTLDSVPAERIQQFANELEEIDSPTAKIALEALKTHVFDPKLEMIRKQHIGLLDEIRKTKLSSLI